MADKKTRAQRLQQQIDARTKGERDVNVPSPRAFTDAAAAQQRTLDEERGLETWIPFLETWRPVEPGETSRVRLVLQHRKHVGGVLYDILLGDGWYYRRPSDAVCK